jgi:hypothetical protein
MNVDLRRHVTTGHWPETERLGGSLLHFSGADKHVLDQISTLRAVISVGPTSLTMSASLGFRVGGGRGCHSARPLDIGQLSKQINRAPP